MLLMNTKLLKYLFLFILIVCVASFSLFIYGKYYYQNVDEPIKVYKDVDEEPKKPRKNLVANQVDTDNNVATQEDVDRDNSGKNPSTMNSEKYNSVNGNRYEGESSIKKTISTNGESENIDTHEWTREEMINHMMSVTGMTRDQIEEGTFYTGANPIPINAWDAASVTSESEFGTRAHYEALMHQMDVWMNSGFEPLVIMASFIIPKTPEGNPIATWEEYQEYSNRVMNK